MDQLLLKLNLVNYINIYPDHSFRNLNFQELLVYQSILTVSFTCILCTASHWQS